MNIFRSRKIRRDTKRVFLKKGACSRTFFFLLNREFGQSMENEEQAADPLAGGILQYGYQCGMIWGAALALGAEAYRRTGDSGKASGMALLATRHVRDSFEKRAGTPNCEEITDTDWRKKWSILKYMIRGKMFKCFALADKWAPEAFGAAAEGLELAQKGKPDKSLNCASETVKKMGGSEQEAAIVSGLAGGLGLSGDGCGALAAAIWKKTLDRVRKGNYKYTLELDPETERLMKSFNKETGYRMECRQICGRTFESVADHTAFIRSGGCEKLISALAGL